MSVVLLERDGRLGQAVEAVLRLNLNRANEWWWKNAAHIPLADWPSYRDGQIREIFDSLEWLPIWELPDGEYVVRQGMGKTVALKEGDRIRFYDISARLRRYDLEEIWRRGEPCPYAYNPAQIAEMWDERVREWRLLAIQQHAPDDCVRTWPPEDQEAVRRAFELARQERWTEALEVAQDIIGLGSYLSRLCGVGR
ncbi:MAG: hypothetical protein J7601_09255 [Chloroflexi bacterium]|jgi:hypothetical protein|nr:hypothetical protein [Chloroflexota bacterium]